MKRAVVFSSVLFITMTLFLTMPYAAEKSSHNLSATVSLMTNYVWRGMTQTDKKPAVQASMDYEHTSGFYAGIWGSNYEGASVTYDEAADDYVAFDSKNTIELDYYVGFWKELGPFELDLMVSYYHYPGSADPGIDPDLDEWVSGRAEADAWEFHVGLSHTFNLPTAPNLSLGYDYSPDYFGEDGQGHHVNAVLEIGLPAELVLNIEGGYQTVEGGSQTGSGWGLGSGWDDDEEWYETSGDGFDYTYYRIGLSKEFYGINFDASYWGTSEKDFLTEIYEMPADEQLVFTVSRTF